MITEEQVKQYRLVKRDNGWYYSEQGLILTEDCDVRRYLSKVRELNAIDDKHNKIVNGTTSKKNI